MRGPQVGAVAPVVLAALALSACHPNTATGTAARAGICTPFATPTVPQSGAPPLAPAAAGDASAPMDDCLHRWAYSLAGGPDTAEMVARATLAACGSALAKWNSGDAPVNGVASDPTAAPLSLVTGQPTNAFAEHRAWAEGRALFYVVQARAGHCAPPPAPKGGAVPS